MHRKFIALILATALVITGISAAPARADSSTAKLLAGLAALALIGAVAHSKRDKPTVTRRYTLPAPIVRGPLSPRPLPHRITRRDLPKQCLRTQRVYGGHRKLVGSRCLRKNYAFNGTLPHACRLGFSDGRRNRIAYEAQCLRERGYRFVRR